MLFCFGFSWPFAIAKTVRAKRVDGKSPMFEVIVIVGYLFGIASHLTPTPRSSPPTSRFTSTTRGGRAGAHPSRKNSR